jgi:hypothetical protein
MLGECRRGELYVSESIQFEMSYRLCLYKLEAKKTGLKWRDMCGSCSTKRLFKVIGNQGTHREDGQAFSEYGGGVGRNLVSVSREGNTKEFFRKEEVVFEFKATEKLNKMRIEIDLQTRR